MAEVDGLRFIAIFGVLLFHVYYAATHVPGTVLTNSRFNFVVWPVMFGFRGVEHFFVISGFNIGLPFAQHDLSKGPPVKLGRFYLRRITRLEPPYILALLIFYGLAILVKNVHTGEPGFYSGLPLRLIYAYFFLRRDSNCLDGPTWSLEIEVQFYLLAPLLAQVFNLDAWPRRIILLAVIFGAPLLVPIVPGGGYMLLGFIQYFFTGFLLADIHTTGTGMGWLKPRLLDLVGLCCLLVMALAPQSPALATLLPWLICGLFMGALRGAWLTAILRWSWVSVLGGMCYSIYLLHNPIYSFVAGKIISNGLSVPQACLRLGLFGLPIVLTAGIAYYVLIERPCMNPNWPHLAFQRISRLIGGPGKTTSK